MCVRARARARVCVCVRERKKFNIYIYNNCNDVLIVSVFFPTCIIHGEKNKTGKHVSLCIHVCTYVPLVIHKPCGKPLHRISRVPLSLPPVALLIRIGDERDEDAKNIGRNDLFPSSCFSTEKRYIYSGSRASACFQTRHVNFIT